MSAAPDPGGAPTRGDATVTSVTSVTPIQAVLRLGEMLPPHADVAMHGLLVGAAGEDAAVRASCLACLAQVGSVTVYRVLLL